MALADIPIIELISRTWPATPLMLLPRLVLLPASGGAQGGRPGHAGSARRRAIPGPCSARGCRCLIAIAGAIGLEAGIAALLPGMDFEWGVIVALALGVACVMAQNTSLGLQFLRAVLAKKSLWSMLFVIVAIFVFKDVMQAAGVVGEMARAAGGDAALIASATFLPFLVGMVAGINVAFVGATFPLMLGVLDTLGMRDQTIPYLVLASFFGFTGVMVSPIHICFILTCQYFGCDLASTWRKVVAPGLIMLAAGVGLFWLLR